MSIDIKHVAAAALKHARMLLPRWLPDGHFEGDEFVAKNPIRDDHEPGSFKVNVQEGMWSDFATGDKGGDLVGLFAYLNKLGQLEAARDVAAQLGMMAGSNGETQHSPCQKDDVVWRIVTPVPADFPPPPKAHFKRGKPSALWTYRNANSKVIGYTCRFPTSHGGKVVLPLTCWQGVENTGTTLMKWRWKAFPTPRPLYGLDRLAARPEAPALVVEGEKTADSALALFPHFVSITSPTGSKAGHKADWSPLRGRRVVICPDYDDEGRFYADTVARLASEAGARSVGLLRWPHHLIVKGGTIAERLDEPQKGHDLADAMEEGWTPELVASLGDLIVPYPVAGLCGSTQTGGQTVESPLSALDNLPPGASTNDIEDALRRFAAANLGDELKRQLARRQAIDLLEKLGIKAPARLVDAALKRSETSDGKGGGSEIILQDPDPWPDPVEGTKLLDSLAAVIAKYVALPAHAADATALWIVHTHTIVTAFLSAILALLSPEKRCGKTTALKIIRVLTPRSILASNITPASLFRVIEEYCPTLLIDEADTFMAGNDELRGIVNCGHTRNSAYVLRTVGDEHKPRIFSTFAAKAIALIGKLPSTIEDRSIVIQMRRRAPDEMVGRLREDRLEEECRPFCQMAARWAKDNSQGLKEADPSVPTELHDRAADNWRPLLAIADLAGGTWPDRARAAAKALSGKGNATDDSAKIQLLADLRDLFARDGRDRLPSERIVSALGEMEDRPWPEWKNGRPISKRQLAGLLKPFGVEPKNVKLTDGSVLKGYALGDFHDVFSRYLPFQSATALPALNDKDLEQNQSATEASEVADENCRNPLSNNGGSAVADWKGGDGQDPDEDNENEGREPTTDPDEEETEWTF